MSLLHHWESDSDDNPFETLGMAFGSSLKEDLARERAYNELPPLGAPIHCVEDLKDTD